MLGYFVTIISSDKDILQLISPNIIMIPPSGKEIFDVEAVIKKMGVEPKLIPDYQSLIGDNVDNVCD
jgi:DNA polymerase-1